MPVEPEHSAGDELNPTINHPTRDPNDNSSARILQVVLALGQTYARAASVHVSDSMLCLFAPKVNCMALPDRC